MVTKAEILKFAPGAKASLVAAIVNNWSFAEAHGINKPARIWQFFANASHETGGFTTIVESLTYSSAQRIYDVFKGPSKAPRFKSPAECKPFVKNAKKLAIKVYGGRMGNKPGPSTDGYDYRGGGMMQTTGRDGYRALGYEDNPSVLQTDPVAAFKTAVLEFEKRGCNALADAGKTDEIRKKINGGTNGLADVRAGVERAKRVWPASSSTKPLKLVPDLPVAAQEAMALDYKDGSKHDVVERVQRLLDGIGYPEVGSIDGRWGSKTEAAILAFRNDNGLPTVTDIDEPLLAALMTAEPRKIAPARANATVADLRSEGAKDIKVADKTGAAGWLTFGLGGLAGGDKALELAEDYSSKAERVAAIIEPFRSFIVENLFIILIGLGGAVAYWAWKQKRIRLEKHQQAKDVSL